MAASTVKQRKKNQSRFKQGVAPGHSVDTRAARKVAVAHPPTQKQREVLSDWDHAS